MKQLTEFFLDRLESDFKGLYPHNFERALKSITCVQIRSIHRDGFKMPPPPPQERKMLPSCHGNQPKSLKRGKKCLHTGQNITSYRNSAKLIFFGSESEQRFFIFFFSWFFSLVWKEFVPLKS